MDQVFVAGFVLTSTSSLSSAATVHPLPLQNVRAIAIISSVLIGRIRDE